MKGVVRCEDAKESHEEASRQSGEIAKGTSRVRYLSGVYAARFYIFNTHSNIIRSSAAKLILLP